MKMITKNDLNVVERRANIIVCLNNDAKHPTYREYWVCYCTIGTKIKYSIYRGGKAYDNLFKSGLIDASAFTGASDLLLNLLNS